MGVNPPSDQPHNNPRKIPHIRPPTPLAIPAEYDTITLQTANAHIANAYYPLKPIIPYP